MSKNKSHAIVVERFKGLHNYATCVTRRVQKSPGVGAVVKGARKRSTGSPHLRICNGILTRHFGAVFFFFYSPKLSGVFFCVICFPFHLNGYSIDFRRKLIRIKAKHQLFLRTKFAKFSLYNCIFFFLN